MGTNPDVDSYSLFFDGTGLSKESGSTHLDRVLKKRGVKTVVLSGIATDYVVVHSALDALKLGFTTFVVDDLIRGITNDGIKKSKAKIKANGGILVSSAQQMAEDTAHWVSNRAAYPPTSGAANPGCPSSRELCYFCLHCIPLSLCTAKSTGIWSMDC